jgi:hypothetical protein
MKHLTPIFALLLAFAPAAWSDDGSSTEAQAVSAFVQKFYDWYTPIALGDGDALGIALHKRPNDFEPALYRALENDEAAQRKAKGDLVGLDFDPILNSQDPGKHYQVGRVEKKEQDYLVEVRDSELTKPESAPDVVAQLEQKDGRWIFVNFHYPENQDLISILKQLVEDRRTYK